MGHVRLNVVKLLVVVLGWNIIGTVAGVMTENVAMVEVLLQCADITFIMALVDMDGVIHAKIIVIHSNKIYYIGQANPCPL